MTARYKGSWRQPAEWGRSEAMNAQVIPTGASHRARAGAARRTRWILAALACLMGFGFMGPGSTFAEEREMKAQTIAPPLQRLSLDEALALFLRQNLDLLIARYGISYAQGQQITARLFPNPVLLVGTLSAMTQGNPVGRSSELASQVQQLFEMAGKRGYRIESRSEERRVGKEGRSRWWPYH